jgi:hypothetical protein
MEIEKCPICNETLLEALKGDDFAWCDNCCAEITEEPTEEDTKMLPAWASNSPHKGGATHVGHAPPTLPAREGCACLYY